MAADYTTRDSKLTQCATVRYLSGMASRTTVNVSLTPELGEFLRKRVQSGSYQTTSEVVREALRLMQRHETSRAGALRELKALLNRGAAQARRGDLIDGDVVFDELRETIEHRRNFGKRPTLR
jgi:antitoxin ParD1/3/4